MSAVASSITLLMSLMISVFVRSSVLTVPRGESRRLTSFDDVLDGGVVDRLQLDLEILELLLVASLLEPTSSSTLIISDGAMRSTLPTRTKPRPLVSRMTSRA